jgi:predicted nucleic acid-binding Zn ribbon protein
MPLIACPECSAAISDMAKACPSCGARVAKDQRIAKRVAVCVFAGVMIFFLIGVMHKPSPEEIALDSDRAAIKLCWSDQGRKSLDPPTARFVASACEHLEAAFRAKYNRAP